MDENGVNVACRGNKGVLNPHHMVHGPHHTSIAFRSPGERSQRRNVISQLLGTGQHVVSDLSSIQDTPASR